MATATVVEPQGFAPDSVYAEYTAEEREISDRMEVESNDHRAWVLAVKAERENHSVHGAPDASLRHLAKLYRRELEDLADGDLLDDSKTGRRTKLAEAKLADVEAEQAFRAVLAESWGAAEDGTHSYTSYMARGGLPAAVHHGATAPSYDLAQKLDLEHFKLGRPHVLAWEESA
jgi:hypothetical protein